MINNFYIKTLKAYIKNNLVNGFIKPFKLSFGAFIFFDKKLNGSLRLYINYWGLNNLTIKNKYPSLLIEKLLDQLGQAKHFTQLKFTNAYY